jgi:cation transport regulator
MATDSSSSVRRPNDQPNQNQQDQNVGFEDQIKQTSKATQDQQATDNSPPNLQTGEQATSGQEGGKSLTMDNLPQDVKEALPEEAQHIFIAAYNSIIANSNDEQTAARVAWQTIETNEHYERGEDGKWRRLPDNAGMHTPIHETSP